MKTGSMFLDDVSLKERAGKIAEQNREEALRESEERYRVLVENSPNVICVHRDGELRYINPAGARFFGAEDASELIGRSVLDFIHPDSLPVVRERLRRLRAGQNVPMIEERFITLRGEVRDVEVISTPIRYERLPSIQVIVRDITEEKRVAQERERLLAREREALAEAQGAEERFSDLVNAVGGIVWELCASTLRFTFVSKRAERVLGYPLERWMNEPKFWHEHIHPEDRDWAIDYCMQETAAGREHEFEYRMIAADGRIVWLKDLVTIVLEGGEVTKLRGVMFDITERKRAEEALRASEELTRGQVEALAQSLDVLATALQPEKFIGKMLSTMCRLLKGKSASLWMLDDAPESLILRLVVEGENPAPLKPDHPLLRDPSSWKHSVIRQVRSTGAPFVCEDIATQPGMPESCRKYLMQQNLKKFLSVPILLSGEVKGMITVRHGERPPYRPEEIGLAQALAHQVMLALRLTDLAEQNRRAAVFEERNRMARDIHDTLAQGFTGVIVQLEAAEDAIASGDAKDADRHLVRAAGLARESLSEARRSVHALRPHALEERNFWDGLKRIIKQTTFGTPLQTKVELRGKLRELPALWQENLLHIGQEALSNTLKHAQASRFEARLTFNATALRLELRDDGCGFKPSRRHDGTGLAGMQERVKQMGGSLNVTGSRSRGTKIVVVSPYTPKATS